MTNVEFISKLLGMKPYLHWFAVSLTSDRDKASDLVQDTYLKVITSKDKFANLTNLKALVFTIMKNTYIDNYRRDVKKNSQFDYTTEMHYVKPSHERECSSTESDYAALEIEKTIDLLGEEFRIPFRMSINGYKYNEIAEELGLNIGTVKSRIFQTRRKLMMMLKDYKEKRFMVAV
jgi:RNA polymerase sigma-70 factor (ECF subfamily)